MKRYSFRYATYISMLLFLVDQLLAVERKKKRPIDACASAWSVSDDLRLCDGDDAFEKLTGKAGP